MDWVRACWVLALVAADKGMGIFSVSVSYVLGRFGW